MTHYKVHELPSGRKLLVKKAEQPVQDTAFALPAYWDRERVERCRRNLLMFNKLVDTKGMVNTGIEDAIQILFYVLNPEKISQDTSDGPVGMDEQAVD